MTHFIRSFSLSKFGNTFYDSKLSEVFSQLLFCALVEGGSSKAIPHQHLTTTYASVFHHRAINVVNLLKIYKGCRSKFYFLCELRSPFQKNKVIEIFEMLIMRYGA